MVMKFYSKQKKWKNFLSKYETLKAERRGPTTQKAEEEAEEEEEDAEEQQKALLTARKGKKEQKRKRSKGEEERCEIDGEEEGENSPARKKRRTNAEEAEHFSQLPLSAKTLAGLSDMNFTAMTPIQQRVLPLFLDGSLTNVIASARTGSGKTLAFLIPAVELVFRLRYKPWSGTGALVLSPTRELCLQTFGVLKQLTRHFSFRVGLLMGGVDRRQEAEDLEKGVTILVATPGRLLDHMRSTPHFVFQYVSLLVIDEADRILDRGFEAEVREIVSLLSAGSFPRVTMLFSATIGNAERQLAMRTIQNRNFVADVTVEAKLPTMLRHSFALFEPQRRLDVLLTFLKSFADRKVMVFFNSCLAVEYFHKLIVNMSHMRPMAIHGKMEQAKRMSTFFRFCKAPAATLLCTDVAARGLDIPDVHWIVQFDPPVDPKDYVHRVGRTARAGAAGQALLLLRPHERGYLRYLQRHFNFHSRRLDPKWPAVEEQASLVTQALNYSPLYLKPLASEAFVSYVRSYASHPLKRFFDPKALDLKAEARNFFGFKKPPRVEL